ncbi:TIGR04540 family protein [Clostridium sp. BJN0001]|uniref:TIGR04540 family protein n=1 Tax=Clostridium sp. BJN0001 TaxID=2930219 RepID=UPI001FD20818|nr:TIGR04540 family protein [Clostridium sp. BJN0001]
MRKVYKNPKELATCLKDVVDKYYDSLITEEKMKDVLSELIEHNRNEIYKDKNMSVKISNVIGKDRQDIIDKVARNILE